MDAKRRSARVGLMASYGLLAVGLMLALAPVWRLIALGSSPTFEEVSQLICSSRPTDRQMPARGAVPSVAATLQPPP